jgi:hypothetical protein
MQDVRSHHVGLPVGRGRSTMVWKGGDRYFSTPPQVLTDLEIGGGQEKLGKTMLEVTICLRVSQGIHSRDLVAKAMEYFTHLV